MLVQYIFQDLNNNPVTVYAYDIHDAFNMLYKALGKVPKGYRLIGVTKNISINPRTF